MVQFENRNEIMYSTNNNTDIKDNFLRYNKWWNIFKCYV